MTKSLEQLRRAAYRAPLMTRIGNSNAWAGRTAMNSGTAVVTVSTNLVNSDCIIQLSSQVGSVNVGSHGNVVVNSIVSGVSFALTRSNSVPAPWNETIMWTMTKTS